MKRQIPESITLKDPATQADVTLTFQEFADNAQGLGYCENLAAEAIGESACREFMNIAGNDKTTYLWLVWCDFVATMGPWVAGELWLAEYEEEEN